jgi:hypothetical protein
MPGYRLFSEELIMISAIVASAAPKTPERACGGLKKHVAIRIRWMVGVVW